MTTEIIYGCKSIIKLPNAYKVTLKDDSFFQIPITEVHGFLKDFGKMSKKLGRQAITDEILDGANIKSIKQELFCEDDKKKQYRKYTTDLEA